MNSHTWKMEGKTWRVTEVVHQKGGIYLNLIRKGKVKTVKAV